MLDEKLVQLKKEFIEYADLAGRMIDKTIQGFVEKKSELFDQVIDIDEPRINQIEIDIDNDCLGLIAQYQPKAKNLRMVMTIVKINNDIERIADQTVGIARSGKYLMERPRFLSLIDLSDVADSVKTMYKNSINAFVKEDSQLARQVCQLDDNIDRYTHHAFKKLRREMSEDPDVIKGCLQFMRVSRNLERIADHSTNICEDVVYLVEGVNIRHNQQ